jgi:outer membrane receptor protein involved in Fe transport
MSVDYFNIELSNLVGTFPVDVAMDRCLTTGAAEYCSLIHRGPSGSILGQTLTAGYVIGTNVNVGAGRTSGIDVQAAYNLHLDRFGWDDMGRLQFNLAGSYLLAAETTLFAGAPTYDCAGLFGPSCQTVNPRWRHNARVTWVAPANLQFSLNWRYFGGVSLDNNSNEPLIGGGVFNPVNARLPARNYFDVSAQWTYHDRYTIRGGINNVFDQDPPLVSTGGDVAVADTGLPNSFTTYDLVGRRLFISLTANF